MSRSADFLLTPTELAARRRQRMRRMVIAGALVLLLVGGYFAVRPTRNAIKGWQARRHATKAFALIDEQRWNEARAEAVAAYQLRPTEPEALRAVARFLSQTRQPQALDFWKQLAERATLTRQDRRDEAGVALSIGEMERAGAAVKEMLAEKNGGPAPADWLLAAQLSARTNAPAEALGQLEKVRENPKATERERLQAAAFSIALAAAGRAPEIAQRQSEAWAQIETLSHGTSETALDALVLLAQRALSPAPSSAPAATPSSQIDASTSLPAPSSETAVPNSNLPAPSSNLPALISALTSHPLAKAPHKLIALDLEMQAHPEARESCLARAVADWKEADTESLVALARWLNGKGEFQRQLDTIPAEKALQSRDLFLQHVDALGALGQWDEIKRLLESERYPLDPVMQKMYLARCNAQLGENAASENNWQRALEAAGGDVSKLMTLAEYAEKNGALAIADAAYTAAAAAAPKLRGAQQGRLRTAQAAKDTRRMHAILAEMLQLWPNDTAIQNDEAYTRLLLLPNDPNSEELKTIEQLAEQLVIREPASLPHRTLLALTLLIGRRPDEALQVYSQFSVAPATLTPAAMAIHSAIMAANARLEDARDEAARIPATDLLDAERTLIDHFVRP